MKKNASVAQKSKKEVIKEALLSPHEFKIGDFTVRVVNKQHYRLYTVMLNQHTLGKQASYPSILDCVAYLKAALPEVVNTIAAQRAFRTALPLIDEVNQNIKSVRKITC